MPLRRKDGVVAVGRPLPRATPVLKDVVVVEGAPSTRSPTTTTTTTRRRPRARLTDHKAVDVVAASTPAPILTPQALSWMTNKASRSGSARTNQ
jgi:hypothetical protein